MKGKSVCNQSSMSWMNTEAAQITDFKAAASPLTVGQIAAEMYFIYASTSSYGKQRNCDVSEIGRGFVYLRGIIAKVGERNG